MKRWASWIPAGGAVAAYAIAPWAGLVWDDQLVAKQQMSAFSSVADVLFPPADIPQWTYSYYRPLVVLSYLVDQALFGRGAAAGPHVANVLYHVIATIGVTALARRLMRDLPSGDWGALFAALLFAVHPIHTESVSWVAGRSDVLATMLLVPALVAVLRWRDAGSLAALLAAALLFFGALMAKEVAITGLLLAPLLLLIAPQAGVTHSSGSGSRAVSLAGALLAFGAAAAAYLALRSAAGTAGGGVGMPAPGEALVRVLRAFGWYVGKLAWPWPQSNFVSWSDMPGVPAAILVVGLALGAALAVGLARRATGGPVAVVGLAWIGITILPAFGVVLTDVAVTPAAERYLYLPSVGLVLVLGVAVARIHAGGWPRAVLGFAAVVVLGAAAATLARGATWRSDLGLWADAVAKTGDHPVPLIEYGKAQFQAGRLAEAQASFERAAAVADTARLRATAGYNLGVLAAMRGDGREAERHFLDAMEADPTYAMAHYGHGRTLLNEALGRLERGDTRDVLVIIGRAREQQHEALRLAPTLATAHLELARALAAEGEVLASGGGPGAAGRLREALDNLDRALALEPSLAGRPEVQDLARRVNLLLQRVPR